MNSVVGPLLGIVEFEKDPPRFSDLGPQTLNWLADAGGFAAFGLAIWILFSLVRGNPSSGGREPRPQVSRWMWLFAGCALAAYTIALVLTVLVLMNRPAAPETVMGPDGTPVPVVRSPTQLEKRQEIALAVAGLFAVLGLIEPLVRDLFRLSGRRIWALAKLSFKEAVRRRVVWAFLAFFIIFLFPASWIPSKPEDELRKTINVIYYGMTPLLVLIGLLLAAFSIPNDIKNQTIHTIVTKPVERFEIVLGRFLGYVGLMTLALFALTTVSLLLIRTSNVDPLAVQESMTARLPVYGQLEYTSRKGTSRTGEFTGVDVGREHRYRKYIAGGELSSHRAIWNFADLPSDLLELPAVPCEFGFDIYRTTKGEENRGVYCSFNVATWKWDPNRQQEYEEAWRKAFGSYPRNRRLPEEDPLTSNEDWEKVNKLAEEFGRYEVRNIEVYDYHLTHFALPTGLFRNALSGKPASGQGFQTTRGPGLLQIQVKCESASQFLGVANWDLYLKEAEGSFILNFYKAAVGLWCRLCIVILLAVSCSTYLAGVISFLVAFFLFLTGHFQDFIRSLAAGTNVGGGPFESLTRLVEGKVAAAPLDDTPTAQVVQFADMAFRWGLRRVLDIIPDVERYGWTVYVKEGFSIRPEFLIMNVVYLLGYLLPWLVLSYYLMRSREVAA